jgi:F0F1-type ATP synthase beta subunit
VLEVGPERIVQVWVDASRADGRLSRLLERFTDAGIRVQETPKHRLDVMADRQAHQGVVIEYLAPDELSEDDKLVVHRARRVQRFLSQPFHVAEQFTGIPGVLVSIEDTIKGFNMIMDGEVDKYPEAAFNLVGTIEDAIAKGEKMLADVK